MALTRIEGFEGFGNVVDADITTYLKQKYNNSGTGPFRLDTGRVTGYSIYSDVDDASQWFSMPTNTTDRTLTVGFGFKPVIADSENIIYFFCSTVGMRIYWNSSSGELSFYSYSGSLLATTSGSGLTVGTGWHYVEVQVYIGTLTDADGSIIIKVDGVETLNVTGKRTGNATASYYTTINWDVTEQYRFDDIYVLDSTGSVNTTFLGEKVVYGVLPNADSGTNEWTPNSGTTNYDRVNDIVPDDDASYVGASAAETLDLYNFADSSQISGILGVQINTMAKSSDGTSYDLTMPVISNSVKDSGSSESVSNTSYMVFDRVVEVDPNTSSLWTVSGLNDALIGIEVA